MFRRLVPVLLLSAAALAAGETRLAFGFGTAKVQLTRGEGVGAVEVVTPPFWKGVRPVAGWHHSWSGDDYFYAGALREWNLGERWSWTFGLAAGYYDYNGGDDLGGPLEFQSRLVLERRWGSGWKAGLAFMHLSNANLYEFNPGSERLLLTLSFPLK
jgi:hypothetical protein